MTYPTAERRRRGPSDQDSMQAGFRASGTYPNLDGHLVGKVGLPMSPGCVLSGGTRSV
jgi:hypothetical protein